MPRRKAAESCERVRPASRALRYNERLDKIAEWYGVRNTFLHIPFL